MPRNAAQKRARWFLRGIEAARNSVKNPPSAYICPICGVPFAHLDELTLEDVPPKAIGGRPLVLTCKGCNNSAGYRLDHYLKAERDNEEIAAGAKAAYVTLQTGQHRVAALATMKPGEFHFDLLPEHSDPRAHRAFADTLEELVRTGSRDWSFNMTRRVRYNPEKVGKAWLRVGYLYAFAALGYRFAMGEALRPLRQLLVNPESELTPGLVLRVRDPDSGDGIALVDEPERMRGILVRLGTRYIHLPGYRDSATFWHRITLPLPETLDLSGSNIPLPQGPEFVLDFTSAGRPRHESGGV